MSAYSKINVVYRLQKWMDSVPGQTFLNYAYSWGASIVILGTLFKLTHLPGANLMLFIGMGTEVIVFFLSAFDRPFDKTADGREIPTHVTEEYLENGSQAQGDAGGKAFIDAGGKTASAKQSIAFVASSHETSTPVVENQPSLAQPTELLDAQNNYVEELKKLVETLGKVNEQSVRLTRDSEEMENLNRTLTGISRVYEMQLKSASQQISTIDQINEQSKKMAQQIEQLNKIYARMIDAMTVNINMRAANMSSQSE